MTGVEENGLAVAGLDVWFGRRHVLRGLNLGPLRRGGLVAVVGPNAAGKSTLLKALAGIVRARAGRMALDGADLGRLPDRERARRVGLLPQEGASGTAALTVFEAVLLAAKQGGGGRRVGDDDLARVDRALGDAGVADLAMRWLAELSGGQRQLVALAQLLAQTPDVLLLDEPTSALDVRNQLELLRLVRGHCRSAGAVAVAALHDLNLAARFADRVALVHEGRALAEGSAEEVLTPELVGRAYGVEATAGRDPLGNPTITPVRALERRLDAAAA